MNNIPTTSVSRRRQAVSYVLTGLVALFLGFDTVIKVLGMEPAVRGTSELGYPAGAVLWIGIIELICLGLFLFPRTAVLGALLMTGYLGGAIASHVRLEHPLLSHTLFPVYVAILLWGGLYLREPRLRAILPIRQQQQIG